MLKILLIDFQSSTKRAFESALSFYENNTDTYILYKEDDMVNASNTKRIISKVTEFDLIILHDNHKYILDKNEYKFRYIVRYTGDTPKNEYPTNEIWIRKRAITDGHPIDVDDAKQIIDWTERVIGDGNLEPFPPILLPPRGIEHLVAIAILARDTWPLIMENIIAQKR